MVTGSKRKEKNTKREGTERRRWKEIITLQRLTKVRGVRLKLRYAHKLPVYCYL